MTWLNYSFGNYVLNVEFFFLSFFCHLFKKMQELCQNIDCKEILTAQWIHKVKSSKCTVFILKNKNVFAAHFFRQKV